jgi:protein-L-isoaspartate(D-aspartate) O-methyltransferase
MGVRLAAALSAMVAAATCQPVQEEARAGTFEEQRARMVERQILSRGVADSRVLDAMRKVPRQLFVPDAERANAYADSPLPIGHGQTISQPYIVGYMTEAIEPKSTDRVLEIGTGSGYQAAVLAELVRDVYTIEIVEPLAASAKATLESLAYRNVHVRHGNGYRGWPEAAPFDKIIVTAAPDEMPQALIDQLAVDGILIAPVGRGYQTITIVRKTATGVLAKETIPVRFVPMVEKVK